MVTKQHYKYPKIERLGHEHNRDFMLFKDDEVVIEEKVDGGNGSFWIDEETGKTYEGSRNRNLITDEDEKAFIKQRLFLRETIKDKKLNPDYIYYIEWMAKHSINYTNAPDIIGLDIRIKMSMSDDGCGLFLPREAREKEFNRLGIENVPLIWKGKIKELEKEKIINLIPQSKYYDGLAEGIVLKNMTRKSTIGNHQLYAKVVRAEFKELNKAVFGGLKKKNTDTSKIIHEFSTEARIKKMVLKFTKEQGEELNLKLMSKVPSAVIKDILKEEFETIFEKYKFIDFKEMKQKISKKCLKVINEMMVTSI